jgi:hypothetical protein
MSPGKGLKAAGAGLRRPRSLLAGTGRPAHLGIRYRGYQTMRRRLLGVIGSLAIASLLASPVSAAAPLENGWDTFTGTAFDSCTGEFFDNSGRVHTVLTEGFSHNNVHYVGIGESSGRVYVGNTTIKAPVHVAPDGTITADLFVNLRLVTKGNAPNLQLTLSDEQVFDSSGILISETTDFSLDCRG